MAVDITRATLSDALELAAKMREADKEEVWASHHVTPTQSLLFAVSTAHVALSVRCDGVLTMIFGVSRRNGPGACPWMLSSEELDAYAVTFYRMTKDNIQAQLNAYGYLENYVDVRNTRSIRWLKWLGFKFDEPAPYGMDGKPFMRFSMGDEAKCAIR